ncbi:YihY/virulence factor BrkB family protein [Jannaschia donghaensis]|uniref:YihY family inner membrane protein n=1 Tax=Jannaschia donghaensis TaxID=420998 RepID=A0A0M6YHT1_9RHOB|nr:YihY/virulence factor BrkB family protein [Jannaschia donghaensis]CTQ48827.1 ribonuclease BN/unknown domain fusion protein [Jannaschia donghaensis]
MKTDKLATTAEAVEAQPGRGRDATGPTKIPKKGLKDVLWRLKDEISNDNLFLVAAGVAFYGLLAIFPAITALMSVAGLLYRPEELVSVLEGASRVVPPDVSRILLEQAQSVAGSDEGGLTLGLALGFGLALWSASSGVGSLIQGLNVAYDEEETRSFVWLKLRTIAMTIAMIIGLIVAAALIVLVPIALDFVAFTPGIEMLIQLVAYVPLALIFIGGVSALYRWGPDRSKAEWKWLTPGALVSSVLWLIASVGFSVYVQAFGSYNETFGSIGGVIVLLMWLWISAIVILLGAELNSELEAQTARDTTTGEREPMGHRGAVKADELGDVS